MLDLSELNLPDNISIYFPDGSEKILDFEITIIPKEGYHRHRQYLHFCLKGGL